MIRKLISNADKKFLQSIVESIIFLKQASMIVCNAKN